jgi:hypothetical protein
VAAAAEVNFPDVTQLCPEALTFSAYHDMTIDAQRKKFAASRALRTSLGLKG